MKEKSKGGRDVGRKKEIGFEGMKAGFYMFGNRAKISG